MKKIYYNNEGYICNLYPYIPVTDDCTEMEITDEIYSKITQIPKNHAWKVDNGKCVCVDMRTQQEKEVAMLERLRELRRRECFATVNRGQVWYDTLSEQQRSEIKTWYIEWLNVTETFEIPSKPNWLK